MDADHNNMAGGRPRGDPKMKIRTSDEVGICENVEFKPRTLPERETAEADTEKLVVLPGFEVTQAKKKPLRSITTWVQCFARFKAAMAQKFPDCTAGFTSHILVVFKAYEEVEEPAWRLYDEAYREKMASTVVRWWQGVDVQVYQETCGGLPRWRTERQIEQRE